ncbi:hypothetical protein FRC03_001736 [Tulasnella sp. 419]|nr:hypothetical protein FRC03_001736 [Tulasnella sp. 419]
MPLTDDIRKMLSSFLLPKLTCASSRLLTKTPIKTDICGISTAMNSRTGKCNEFIGTSPDSTPYGVETWRKSFFVLLAIQPQLSPIAGSTCSHGFFLLQRSPASVTVCHGRFFHESGYILEKSAENTTLTSPLLAILPTLETSLQPCFNSSMVGLGRHARQAHVDRCQHPSRPWILSIGMCSRSTPVQTA